MKHFVYETIMDNGEEYEFVIFAGNDLRAAQILAVFHSIADRLERPWHPETWENYETFGEPAQLEEALARGEEGLGCFTSKTGWTIIPLPEIPFGFPSAIPRQC